MILHKNAKDLTGQRFTRLKAVRPLLRERSYIKWECVCDCGVVVIVRSSHLLSGQTESCGCYRDDFQAERLRNTPIAWKGGVTTSNGYVKRRTSAYCQRAEHRIVMEQMIGRTLLECELVHHKDGNKANNDPGNLEIVTRSQHARLHHPDIPKGKKLDKFKVGRIKEYFLAGIPKKELATLFKVSVGTIRDIIRGKYWADVCVFKEAV